MMYTKTILLHCAFYFAYFFNVSVWWIVCRLQSYNIQKPVPRQHVCSIPALGMLPRLCHKSGGTSTRGADCGSTRARPTVRRVCTRMPSSVSCKCRAVSKSSAVYCEATATPATSGCCPAVVTQLIWYCVCFVTLQQSRSLLGIVYVMLRKLSSIVLCFVMLYMQHLRWLYASLYICKFVEPCMVRLRCLSWWK